MAMKQSCSRIRVDSFQQTLVCLLILTINGCATHAADLNTVASKADPYERVNRKIYHFNDTVDSYVAAPISDVYRYITPQFVQTGVFNFYNNLKNINVVANDVLQAKFKQSAEDTGRFAINSTVGVVGLFDVAKKIGLEQNNEDFEQTLAVWGVKSGPYLVIPLLGPSTVRGVPGAVFDTATNPSSYVGAPIQLLSLLNTRANAEGALKFIDEAALDPYVFTRESFLQWRSSLATDGQASPDFNDELEEGDLAIDSQKTPVVASQPTPANANIDRKSFSQVADSFVNTATLFDKTAKSFEQASNKLKPLKNNSAK